MSASIFSKRVFTKEKLKDLYYSSVRFKTAVGIDKINKKKFENNLEENINVIYYKVRNGSYKFSRYREKLILRGRNKFPRVVSIPTIRDKLTLKALYEILSKVYENETPFVHRIIKDVSTSLNENEYNGVIRLDVKNFYPSINHDILFNQIRKKIRNKDIIKLINCAITQSTVDKSIKNKNEQNSIGVHQGLSISNILANIYFLPIDKKYSKKDSLKYFRYVDDILILCNFNNIVNIKEEFIEDCKELELELHSDDTEKFESCLISNGFTYLGYVFNSAVITVRKKSIDHMRETIIKLFTNYKYSDNHDINKLKWVIDLRITGCIFNETKYGWLFFFSQINDFQLLNSLDHFIKKQMIRFGIDSSKIKFKRFIRTFHEITKNLSNTSYIPNFDKILISDKRIILRDIFGLKTKNMKSDEIEYHFNRNIYKTVKDLEKDLARAS